MSTTSVTAPGSPTAGTLPVQLTHAVRSASHGANVLRRLVRNPIAMTAAGIIALLILVALLAPWIMPSDPFATSMFKRLRSVGTSGFPLGTDELGRDMLSRLMLGGRLSLFMGIAPVIMAFVIGSGVGILAGYAGGKVNTVIMRCIDVLYAFPSVLLAIALSGALGAGITNALISLTVVFVPQIARIAESVTTQVRRSDYVDAARASGAPAFTIVRRHVFGNVIGPIFVYSTSLISVSMILASGLSFLGLGVKPPQPEWGLMLNTLRTAIYSQPLIAALPGVLIFITSVSFNMLADGLRAAMEVKQ
ncbi:ABC transporter permease [Variovorax sp. RTB1]|jgi:peptide/nickel transport system permease protein|uniref:ABC transporter permease n=1 Tax=Variovorax sp. RTB1 TaxID=3048631 RepID=UPI002B22DEEB|nr:ABC transporter permease [Variovorax sp. RTB1]MEB0110372.1 ABC transporter permease [Variovorax sp. RTB1]